MKFLQCKDFSLQFLIPVKNCYLEFKNAEKNLEDSSVLMYN